MNSLNWQLNKLSNQIEKFRWKINLVAIGEDKDLEEFTTVQNKGHEDLVESLNYGDVSDNLKQKINHLSSQAGVAGSDRQKLIKAAIKIIIENIIPNRVRILFNYSKEESKINFSEYFGIILIIFDYIILQIFFNDLIVFVNKTS